MYRKSRLDQPRPRTGSQDSRDEILKAAMRLFASRGFHETSMSEVAREAHVSKALIFWHFKTKEELFVAVLNRLLEPYFIDFAEEAAAMDERAADSEAGRVVLVFRARQCELGAVFPGADAPRPEAVRRPQRPGAETLRGISRDAGRADCGGAAEGTSAHGGPPPESAAAFLLSALNGLLIEYLFMGANAIDPEGAVAMVGEWLFGPSGTSSSEGGAPSA